MTSTTTSIARIAGPGLVALGITEALNIDVFAGITAPVVYLNGTILLVAGVAIVQAHNRWVRDWSVLVTLVGWGLCAGGLYRMIAPTAPQLARGPAAFCVLAALTVVGAWLSYKGFGDRLSVSRPGGGRRRGGSDGR